MAEENDDDIRPLYLRFKDAIDNGESTSDFDEIDLVSIYDYAGDIRDYYTQFEVLLLAARRYPDNQELGSRKGFFVRDILDNPAEASRIAHRHTGESFAWVLLDLTTSGLPAPDLERRLDKALDHTDTLDDEDIIRLIDLVQDNKLFDWISRRRQAISRKCDYPDTLLREMAEMFYEAGMVERTVELYEEATRLQPFHAPFWLRLSEMQEMNEDFDAAQTSIEYALAIDPADDSYFLQSVRLRYYGGLITPDDEKRMASIVAADDANSANAARLLCSWLATSGRFEELAAKAGTMLADATSPEVASELLDRIFDVPNVNVILNALVVIDKKELRPSLQEVKDKVSHAFRERHYHAVVALCFHYADILDDAEMWPPFIESVYRLGDYGLVIEIYNTPKTPLKIRPFAEGCMAFATPLLAVGLSMLRQKKFHDYEAFVAEMMQAKPDGLTSAEAMQHRGVMTLLTTLAASCRDAEFDLDSLDPFVEPLQ